MALSTTRRQVAAPVVLITMVTILVAGIIAGQVYTARIVAERKGSSLILTAWGSAALSDDRRTMWIGIGLRNTSKKAVTIHEIRVIPECTIVPGISANDVFMTDLPEGPPPIDEDPRRVYDTSAYPAAEFVIPPKSQRGGFIQFTLAEGSAAAPTEGWVNVYTVRVEYSIGGMERVYQPPRFMKIFRLKTQSNPS